MPPRIDRFRLHADLDALREKVLSAMPDVIRADVNDPAFILDPRFNPIATDFFLQQYAADLLSHAPLPRSKSLSAAPEWLGDPASSWPAWVADRSISAADWIGTRFVRNVYPLVRFRYGASDPFSEELDADHSSGHSRRAILPPIFLPKGFAEMELRRRGELPYWFGKRNVSRFDLHQHLKDLEDTVREYRSAVYPNHQEGDIFKSNDLLKELENRQISLNLPYLLAPYFEALSFDKHVGDTYNNLLAAAKRGELNEQSLQGALLNLFQGELRNLSAMAGYNMPDESGGSRSVLFPSAERINELTRKILAGNLVKPKNDGTMDVASFEKFRDLLKQQFLNPYNDDEFYRWRHSLITPADVFKAVDNYKKYIDPADFRVRAELQAPGKDRQNDGAAQNFVAPNIAQNVGDAMREKPSLFDFLRYSAVVFWPALMASLSLFYLASMLRERRQIQKDLDRFNRSGKREKKKAVGPAASGEEQSLSEEVHKSASDGIRFPVSNRRFLRDFFGD